jgi:hypothetical protein
MDNINMKQSLPLDLLLLLLLIPAQVELFARGDYFLIMLLMMYTAVTLWQPLSDLEQLPTRFGPQRLAFLLRLAIIFLILLITPITIALQNIQTRQAAQAGQGDLAAAHLQMHDGAYQEELAVDYLLAGVNPYVATYDDPLLEIYQDPEIAINPAVEHMIYLPGLLVLTIPFREMVTAVLGHYDQRYLYLAAYILLVLLLPTLVQKPTHKLALLIAAALNPWLIQPVSLGMNDIIVILFVVLAALLLHKQHSLWGALLFGLACTMKQSAWLMAPFFLLAIYAATPPPKRWPQTATAVAVMALVMLLIVGPFALWNLPAFMDDTFAYASGTAASLNYPIRGYTLGRLFVAFGVVATAVDYYPFWQLQLLFGLPLMLICLFYQWRQPSLQRMFLAASFFIFGLGFVSRYFQDNYVGFVVMLALLGLFPTFSDPALTESPQP